MTDLPARIEAAFDGGDLNAADVEEAIDLIDRGEVRVAEPADGGSTSRERRLAHHGIDALVVCSRAGLMSASLWTWRGGV